MISQLRPTLVEVSQATFTIFVCAFCLHSTACRVSGGCENHDDAPLGEMNQYPHVKGGWIHDVNLEPPQLCENGSAHIRMKRERGKRKIGIFVAGDDSPAGCRRLPSDSKDGEQCPIIDYSVILHVVADQLKTQGITVNGIGLGPCGNSAGGYLDWNMSVGVVDWSDANEAVQSVADLLLKYDLRGSIGVAVRGIECVEYPEQLNVPNNSPELAVCDASLELNKSVEEQSEPLSSPSLNELLPNTAFVRFLHYRGTDHTPILVESFSTSAKIFYDEQGFLEPPGWGMRIKVKSPELDSVLNFWIHFSDNDVRQLPLTKGQHIASVFGLDIPTLEQGDQCRVSHDNTSPVPTKYTVNIAETNGSRTTGAWTGSILHTPAFYSQDSTSVGEKIVWKSVLFKEIETEMP